MMLGPSENDWCFQKIKKACPERASRLADAGSPDALIEALDDAISEAFVDDVRIGFDGVCNNLKFPRVTIQFPVSAELYDWFFNARTSYRAQYWISSDSGHTFNTCLLSRLRTTIERRVRSRRIEGRKIWVVKHNDDREDVDKGPWTENRSTVLTSLDPKLSKIWICERLIQRNGGALDQMAFGFMDPKLQIARWQGNGLFAPYPERGKAWLDVKGGYVWPDGEVRQPNKTPEVRSQNIHDTGWT